MRILGPAPDDALDDAQVPRMGAFGGRIRRIDLAAAARAAGLSRPARLFAEKRWLWFGAGNAACAIGGAVVDLGWTGNVFLWILDRRARRLLVDETAVLPAGLAHAADAPSAPTLASVRLLPTGSLRATRAGDRVWIEGKIFGATIELELDGAGLTPLAAVCPVPGGRLNVTHKEAGLSAHGTVVVRGQRLALDGAGFLDHTHGLLARRTAWRWAAAFGHAEDGRPIGLNLVHGFNDGLENAVFVGGKVLGVGAATFTFDAAKPATPWTVTTDDNAVELTLAVEAVRSANIDLRVARSRYEQPIGGWSGRIADVRVSNLLGVAEDHEALW